jgi:phage terminase Nu1 subunit (DNA packaging protein)
MTPAERQRRSRKGAPAPAEGAASAARARLALAQAELAETKTRALRGSLLEAETVRAEWGKVLTLIRARVLAVPSRLQQVAPHLTVSDIEALDCELREALSELADQG